MMNSYLELHENSDFKVGDVVIVTRAAESEENGWQNGWIPPMSNWVGKKCVIERDKGDRGFTLKLLDGDGERWDFPYFILMKEKPRKAEDILAEWI